MFFGFIERGNLSNALRLTLTSRSRTPFRVLGVEVTNDRIGVEEVGAGEFDVVVDTFEPGLLEGQVVVSTTAALEETLRVPVYAHILP